MGWFSAGADGCISSIPGRKARMSLIISLRQPYIIPIWQASVKTYFPTEKHTNTAGLNQHSDTNQHTFWFGDVWLPLGHAFSPSIPQPAPSSRAAGQTHILAVFAQP